MDSFPSQLCGQAVVYQKLPRIGAEIVVLIWVAQCFILSINSVLFQEAS